MRSVYLLEAIYSDPYGPEQKEILGVFSDMAVVKEAIQAYKDRKIKWDAEVLLERTEFKTTEFDLDEIKN